MPTYCYKIEKIGTQVNRLQSICNPVYQDLGSTTKREQCPSPMSHQMGVTATGHKQETNYSMKRLCRKFPKEVMDYDITFLIDQLK